jgi:hypothetical protein
VGVQLVMWTTIAVAFGVAAERVIERAGVRRARAAPAR